jgi:hypothetical protein
MKLSERIDGTLYACTDPENVLFDGLDDLDNLAGDLEKHKRGLGAWWDEEPRKTPEDGRQRPPMPFRVVVSPNRRSEAP